MGQEIAVEIGCEGGLDLTSTPRALFNTPGAATKLVNYEALSGGGYRRINGFTRFGGGSATTPAGTATKVLGIFPYADGLVAAQDDGLYFSTDGITWIQVNKSGASAGVDAATLAGLGASARTDQGKNYYSLYESNEEYGVLTVVDGVNAVAQFKITDTGGRKYYYTELTSAVAAPANAKYSEVYKERLVLAGDTSNPNMVTWSDRYDVATFLGSSAGQVDVGRPVTGLKVFRDTLYIFCKDAIFALNNIDLGPQVVSVTDNVGCVCGFTIQEVGGDLLFLAQDGLRNLAATEQIGDVELSTVSRKITPLTDAMVDVVSTGCLISTVIRNKNQYRIFYPDATIAERIQKGVIGVLKYTEVGVRWEWSETKGIEASYAISAIVNGDEVVYHGNLSGEIFIHDSGNNFNGEVVPFEYKTPDLHFGDETILKTLQYARISLSTEGIVPEGELRLATKFDFSSLDIHQPIPTDFASFGTPSIYGSADYGTNSYGVTNVPIRRMLLEGSGHTVSLWFYGSSDTSAPHSINGFSIVATIGKRL